MKPKTKTVYLMANGDLRLSANQKCWPEQAKMEAVLTKALRAEGWSVRRAHAYDPKKKHGFIDSQKRGMEVFRFANWTQPFRWLWPSVSGNTVITCGTACSRIAGRF
jgi:hypothetical protein